MFCKYCGSEIKDNDSFCGVCGKRVKKGRIGNKWLIAFGVIVALIIILGFIVTMIFVRKNENIRTSEENVRSESDVRFNNETYEYDDYVKLQKDTYSLDIRQFFPRDGVYTYENHLTEDGSFITSESISTSYTKGIAFKEYNEVVDDYSYGRYDMTDSSASARMIKIYDSNILGSDNKLLTMVPIDSIYQIGENPDRFMGSPVKNFTVSVKAGEFNNCVCMVKYEKGEYSNDMEILYYAPHVGLVLELTVGESNSELFGSEWAVTKELIEIGINNKSLNSEEESVETSDSNTGKVDTALLLDIELSNNLVLKLPQIWAGNYELFEGNTYYTFCEKQNYDTGNDGTLFYINKCYSSDELEYFPESKVLGVYNDNGTLHYSQVSRHDY